MTIVIRDPLLSKIEDIENSSLPENIPNINEYIVTCLSMLHEDEGDYPDEINMDELASIIRDESKSYVSQAKLAGMNNNEKVRTNKLLKAASLELEALSIIENRSPDVVISSVLIALTSIKEALGFKRLPEV